MGRPAASWANIKLLVISSFLTIWVYSSAHVLNFEIRETTPKNRLQNQR